MDFVVKAGVVILGVALYDRFVKGYLPAVVSGGVVGQYVTPVAVGAGALYGAKAFGLVK